ncbi:hypothetical protein GCM10023116_37330 [Kistimonas scapharcae]|uniref:Transposase n=1 Tax=Kistimonas scapharcae TaxID=1036133 RepID=A0ABP8V7Q3_9GAMM
MAHVFGRRTKAILNRLIALIKPYKFRFYCNDDRHPYSTELSEDGHVVSKHFTRVLKETI